MGQSEKDIAQVENKMLTEVEKHGFNPALGMRAALLIARSYICGTSDTPQTDVLVAIDAALDSPRRNCDVGTAEEQTKRFKEFCESVKPAEPHYSKTGEVLCPSIGSGRECKLGICNFGQCALKWAQMPYEEGEAK